MEKIMDFVKNLFVNKEGQVNWKTLVGLGVGAVAGGTSLFGLLGEAGQGFSLIGTLIGAVAGIAGAAVLENVMSPAAPAPGAEGAPGTKATGDRAPGLSQEINAPGASIPKMPPAQARGGVPPR